MMESISTLSTDSIRKKKPLVIITIGIDLNEENLYMYMFSSLCNKIDQYENKTQKTLIFE